MSSTLTLEPIGFVRSPFREPADAPRQACVGAGVEGRIELVAGRHLEDAVADLATFTHLWIVFWFHKSRGYRPKVLPPRSRERRGVLATRSPHRPNPIGLSVVRLERVVGLVVHVRDLDILDATPVLDLKPYIPYADAVPGAGSGWLTAPMSAAAMHTGALPEAPDATAVSGRPDDPLPAYRVTWSAAAEEQLAFLAAAGVALQVPVSERLALGPQPHAYRRITLRGDAGRLAYKDWRCAFRVNGRAIEVVAITSGYRPRELAAGSDDALAAGSDDALALHRAFVARFGT